MKRVNIYLNIYIEECWRLLALMLCAVVLTSCAKDSISRRYDYTNASHNFGEVKLTATVKASEWKVSKAEGFTLNELIGPYHLSLITTQHRSVANTSSFTVSRAQVGYVDKEPLLTLSNIKLKENRFIDKKKLVHLYREPVGIDIEYKPILINLDVSYLVAGNRIEKKIVLIVEPKPSSKHYNSLLAKLMSV